MGYDWYLDKQVWVRFTGPFSCTAEMTWTPSSFHNVWEFWAYNVVFGLFQAPYYAFSQTMMAELSPPGFDNMVRHTIPSSMRSPALSEWGKFSFLVYSGCRTARRP